MTLMGFWANETEYEWSNSALDINRQLGQWDFIESGASPKNAFGPMRLHYGRSNSAHHITILDQSNFIVGGAILHMK